MLFRSAAIAFEAENFAEAHGAAQSALVAAEAARRMCEVVTSRALLARVLIARGDPSGAKRCLDPILDHVGDREGIGARAHAAWLLAARALGLSVPTMDQTLS